jgi:hypothetical protein
MQQVSVNMPDDLLAWVTAAAERDVRPLALQIRYYVAEAMRAELLPGTAVTTRVASPEPEPGANASSRPPIPTDYEAQKAELAELEAKRGRLVDLQRRRHAFGGLSPTDEQELGFVQSRIGLLRSHIKVFERAKGIGHD